MMEYPNDAEEGSSLGLILFFGLILAIVAIPSILFMRGDNESSGRIEVSIPLDDVAMPSPPGCEDEDCEWNARGGVDENGCINWLHVALTLNGCKVSENEMVKIETEKYEQTADLAEAGHDEAWVSGIEVDEAYQGQGIGRATWKAGDEVLKLVDRVNPVHVFADAAGWGKSIMSEVEEALILIKEEGFWAYLVK